MLTIYDLHKHETHAMDRFTYGVANGGSSIRISRRTVLDGKGYMKDRRPAANIDPYLVTNLIFKNTVLC
jgi:glutamine synthetase